MDFFRISSCRSVQLSWASFFQSEILLLLRIERNGNKNKSEKKKRQITIPKYKRRINFFCAYPKPLPPPYTWYLNLPITM